MSDLVTKIEQADPMEINDALHAVLKRYNELFPEWNISTISVEKNGDHNEQLDRIINLLQSLKTH